MSPYCVCCGYDLHLDRSVVDVSIYLRYCSAACIYFSFRWGPFVHSLGIVQWDSTRRDHPGYPGRVFGSGPVMVPHPSIRQKCSLSFIRILANTGLRLLYQIEVKPLRIKLIDQ